MTFKIKLSLLKSNDLISDDVSEGANCEVLYSAAWVVGEFSKLVKDYMSAVNNLLQPRVLSLPNHIQRFIINESDSNEIYPISLFQKISVYIQALLKLFSTVAHRAQNEPTGKIDNTVTEK